MLYTHRPLKARGTFHCKVGLQPVYDQKRIEIVTIRECTVRETYVFFKAVR